VKQEPLVNIGDLVWVKLKNDKFYHAFIFQINYWGEENVASYYAQFLEERDPQTTSLYGVDYTDVWGKLSYEE
jgi:hypothetical protein